MTIQSAWRYIPYKAVKSTKESSSVMDPVVVIPEYSNHWSLLGFPMACLNFLLFIAWLPPSWYHVTFSSFVGCKSCPAQAAVQIHVLKLLSTNSPCSTSPLFPTVHVGVWPTKQLEMYTSILRLNIPPSPAPHLPNLNNILTPCTQYYTDMPPMLTNNLNVLWSSHHVSQISLREDSMYLVFGVDNSIGYICMLLITFWRSHKLLFP